MSIRQKVREWLGVNTLDANVEAIERLILHRESRMNGFAVLKKHLNRPDKELPTFMGEPIEQD